MENREKTVNLLESFLSDKQVDGVCGYIVDPDGEGPIQVIVVLDIDYIQEANTKPGFIARMIKQGVKQEIEKWIGFDVYVGSTARLTLYHSGPSRLFNGGLCCLCPFVGFAYGHQN